MHSDGLHAVLVLFCLSVRGQENGLDGGKSGGSSEEAQREGDGDAAGAEVRTGAVGTGRSGEVWSSLKREAAKLVN